MAMVTGGMHSTGQFPAIGQQVDVVLPTGRRSTDRTTFTGTVTQIVGDTVLVTFEQPFPVAFVEGKVERLGFTWMPIEQVKPHPAGQ
jgi:hypothetical protein